MSGELAVILGVMLVVYDPMIAKVIVHGSTREVALSKLRAAERAESFACQLGRTRRRDAPQQPHRLQPLRHR